MSTFESDSSEAIHRSMSKKPQRLKTCSRFNLHRYFVLHDCYRLYAHVYRSSDSEISTPVKCRDKYGATCNESSNTHASALRDMNF